MRRPKVTLLAAGTTIATVIGAAAAMAPATASAATAATARAAAKPSASFKDQNAKLPLKIKRIGTLPNGKPKLTATAPTGLSPSAVQSVYNLSGLSASSGAGAGQVITIVDAFDDPNALADLNTFNSKYGYPQLSTCTSLSQAGACFEKAYPGGSQPRVNSNWALEEALDIEWAHAEAPAAKIVLAEAATNSNANLFGAVNWANANGATEVSMSWGGGESSTESSYDADMAHPGTLYTASAGDSGHAAEYPAASPNVVSVGGTTLNGCSGTSCSGYSSETTWTSSGGGVSADESIPAYQAGYTGPVYGASTISALTGAHRGIPDISFDGNPNTGVSVYDSTTYQGQSGWWTLGGTSVGAPNWAGILAAGNAAGSTALQGDAAIYSSGGSNLRDITSGTNGTCGTDCTAGTGYDLITGLGSPVNYP